MSDVRSRVQTTLREVFDDATLIVRDDMSAGDFDTWDSMQHINIVIAIEEQFGIRFTTSEIAKLKQPGENIGSLVRLLERKLAG